MPQTGLKSPKLRRFFPFLVLSWVLAVPLVFTQQPDWQMIDVDGLFSFSLPHGWTRHSSFNVAEVRGEWAKGETRLAYVWGQSESGSYSDRRQSWMNDYEETTTRLSGRRADIRTFSRVKDGKRTYQAELNVGNWEKGEIQLYMRVEGNDATTIELAKQIFKSVTLPLPSPERPPGRRFWTGFTRLDRICMFILKDLVNSVND